MGLVEHRGSFFFFFGKAWLASSPGVENRLWKWKLSWWGGRETFPLNWLYVPGQAWLSSIYYYQSLTYSGLCIHGGLPQVPSITEARSYRTASSSLTPQQSTSPSLQPPVWSGATWTARGSPPSSDLRAASYRNSGNEEAFLYLPKAVGDWHGAPPPSFPNSHSVLRLHWHRPLLWVSCLQKCLDWKQESLCCEYSVCSHVCTPKPQGTYVNCSQKFLPLEDTSSCQHQGSIAQ